MMNQQIKLSDLSVGDWMLDGNNNLAQILAIENWSDGYVLNVQIKEVGIGVVAITRVRPIPITRKILLNNGFVRNKEYSYMYHNKDLGFTFEWFTKNNNTVSNSYKRGEVHIIGENIRYVHQLQHLLRLAGIDEQIKL